MAELKDFNGTLKTLNFKSFGLKEILALSHQKAFGRL
eukprot:UN00431